MDFEPLLKKARSTPLEWTNRSLSISDMDAAALQKLTWIRHGIEHPKPGFWVIEPAYIFNVIPVAVSLALELLEGFHHHFELGELELARAAERNIRASCST